MKSWSQTKLHRRGRKAKRARSPEAGAFAPDAGGDAGAPSLCRARSRDLLPQWHRDHWVRGSSDPLPPQAANNTRREAATILRRAW